MRPGGRLARALAALAIGVVALAGGVFLLIPLAAHAFVRGIELLTAGCIWLATSISSGVSPWSMAATVWQTGASALGTPAVSAALWGLVLVGLVAFYLLQRLLSRDEP